MPGMPAARIAAQVRTVDVAPTIINVVTGEQPRDVQGQSLLPMLRGEKEPPRSAYSESMATRLQYGWAALYGLRTNQFKFIEAPRSELYDLAKDPSESNNRLEEERRVALQLRGEL